MRANRIIVASPVFNQYLSVAQRCESFAIREFVPELRVQALTVAILPWTTRLDIERLDADPAESRTFLATNSGPLSERMCSGGPCVTKRSARHWSTSWDLSRLATTIARHRRVNSSSTTSMRKARPSWVRSWTKSYDQTWFDRAGLSRTHDPSLSQRRPRFGCFIGTFSPSRRQIR